MHGVIRRRQPWTPRTYARKHNALQNLLRSRTHAAQCRNEGRKSSSGPQTLNHKLLQTRRCELTPCAMDAAGRPEGNPLLRAAA